MAEPRDPDTEDRRPDYDRLDDDDLDDRDDHAQDDVDVEDEAEPTRNDRWIDDGGDLIDFDLDDLRGMEGPDA